MTIMNKYSKIFSRLELLLEKTKDLRDFPEPKKFARVQKELLQIKLDLSSTYLMILSNDDLEYMIGKIESMLEKNTKLARKYEKTKELSRR